MELERQYKVCNFGLKAEIRWSLKRSREIRWSLKQTCWLPRVYSPAVELLHQKGPRHRRKIRANSLWLYSYFTKTSKSKNKNMNYIFIYLQVLCLSRGMICDLCWWKDISSWFLMCIVVNGIVNSLLPYWKLVRRSHFLWLLLCYEWLLIFLSNLTRKMIINSYAYAFDLYQFNLV